MLILASQSPRRKELLTKYGYEFKVIPSAYEEEIDLNKTPYENSLFLAYMKALEIYKNNEDDVVLASDTIVTLDGVIFGKPKDKCDAYSMLKGFSGRTHEVVSSVCIMSKVETFNFFVVSKVTFKELTDDEINWYLSTDEPYDKAGSYAIQGLAGRFVEKFEGSLNNIIGLPIEECIPYLDRLLGR